MISKNSFRYYESFGNFMRSFDRGVSHFQFNLIFFILNLLYLVKFSFFVKYFVTYKIKKKKIVVSDIKAVVFSSNHKTIYKSFYDLGFCYPVYDFSGNGVDGYIASVFSSKLIFFSALINIKRTISELKGSISDPILFANSIRIIKLCGEEYIYNIILKDMKVLIKYNDHGPDAVLLSDMAAARGIKTVYIQHAPVSERFPPLYHDLNVLFSEDSLTKYKVLNESIKKFVFFDVRFFDRIVKTIDSFNNTILVCTNDQDDIEIVKKLVLELSNSFKIIVRPHPGDRRNWKGDYELSSNRLVWEDIERAKYVLANESGIFLEAIYADRLCYKCSFFSKSFDNYGFLEKGLILREYNFVEDLVTALHNDDIATNKDKLNYFIGQSDLKNQKLKQLQNEILALRN